ncbi:hypothetical protein GCM10023238_16790 [Streptomyces heliomycini]
MLPTATVEPDAKLAGGTVVGEGAFVAEGARVFGSTILPGAVIEPGAVITDSLIGTRARVGEHTVLTGTVIATSGRRAPATNSVRAPAVWCDSDHPAGAPPLLLGPVTVRTVRAWQRLMRGGPGPRRGVRPRPARITPAGGARGADAPALRAATPPRPLHAVRDHSPRQPASVAGSVPPPVP